MTIIWLKSFLGVLALLLALLASNLVATHQLSNRTFSRAAFASLAITRLGMFVVVFLLMRVNATSDVTVYYDEALAVLGGKIPLVEIKTAYGFFFDYIAAGAVGVWRSPIVLVMLSVMFELASFPIWLRVGRNGFSELTVRLASVLYVFNPLAFSTVVLAGQNHVWISFFLALSLWLISKGKDTIAGLALGLSVIAVKLLGLLFFPILFLIAKRRVSFTLSFFSLVGFGYVIPFLLGARLGEQVIFHALYPSSGNIPYLLGMFGISFAEPRARLVADFLAFLLLCTSFLIVVSKYGPLDLRKSLLLCVFVMVVTLLVQEKSFTTYGVITLFPCCLALAQLGHRPGVIAAIQSFWALATLEPSLWFRWLKEWQLTTLWADSLPDGMSRFTLGGFAAVELALVLGYVAVLLVLIRQLRSSSPLATSSALSPL